MNLNHLQTLLKSTTIKYASIFEFEKMVGNNKQYRCNVNKLADDKCHMFFARITSVDLLIASMIEFNLFNPSKPELNKKFTLLPVDCGPIHLYWCSFPKEYAKTFEKAGEVYKKTRLTTSRAMALYENGIQQTILVFPKHEKLMLFKDDQVIQCLDEKTFEREFDNIKWFANSVDRLGVD